MLRTSGQGHALRQKRARARAKRRATERLNGPAPLANRRRLPLQRNSAAALLTATFAACAVRRSPLRAAWLPTKPQRCVLAALLLLRPAVAQLPYGVTVYPMPSFGSGLPGNSSFPINAAALSGANATALLLSSGMQCNYMEQQFTELFSSSTLNLTKWLPTGSVRIPAGQRPTTYGTSNYATPWGPAQFGAYQVRACACLHD